MEDKQYKNALNNFLGGTHKKPNTTREEKLNDNQTKVCDDVTGECHINTSKDGLVERINKKFITEDGRQLLRD